MTESATITANTLRAAVASWAAHPHRSPDNLAPARTAAEIWGEGMAVTVSDLGAMIVAWADMDRHEVRLGWAFDAIDACLQAHGLVYRDDDPRVYRDDACWHLGEVTFTVPALAR